MKPTKIERVLVLLLFLFPFFSIAQDKIVKIKIFAPEEINARASLLGLLEIDHFITDTDGGIVSEINTTTLAKLKNTTYQYQILVPDVMKQLDSLNKIYYASLKNPLTRVAIEQPGNSSANIIVTPAAFQVKATFGGYYSFAEMEAAMDALVASYPTLATKTSIGTTVGGNNIWVIKISDNAAVDELNEPEVLFMGLQHAREAIGGSSMIFLMQYLCERYAMDSRIKDLVDNREIYIIPCLNPDGWEYNRTNWSGTPGGDWRKNRKDNGGGVFGVDLNRNWSVDWANCSAPISGSAASCGSATTSAQTYWGTAAFSEFETNAVRNFVKAHHVICGFDQHSYGPYYSLPFGRQALHTMGTKGNQFYTAVPALMGMYNGMRAANSFDALGYEVAGGFKDYMLMGEIGTGISGGLKDSVWAMTGEGAAGGGTTNSVTTSLGTQNFWAPAGQIINLSKSMCYQNLQLAYSAGSYVDVHDNTNMSLSSLTGSVTASIQRLGLTDAPITVQLVPIENVQSVGAPVTIPGMVYYATTTASINYTLPPSLVNGQRVRYAWKVTTGGITYSDTVIKFLNPIVLLSDNMQGTFGTNWSNPAGSTATWLYTASGGYNSTQALSESAAGTNYTANQTQICLYKSTFNLVGATAAYLTFWTRHRIENFCDKCQVQVSTNGSTWTAIQGSTTVQEPGTLDGSTLNGIPAFTGIRDYWTPEVFDLGAYKGAATLSLRFVFTTDSDPSTFKFEVDDGIYIDDLSVIKSNTFLFSLPVNFLSFTGSLQSDQTVKLDWEAVVDNEHDYFAIERSSDGSNYSTIGVGPQMAPYQFIDQHPNQGNNFYRIRQVDKNGSVAYSKVVSVVVSKPVTITLYPNPVIDILNLKLSNKQADQLKIELTDVQGRSVYSKVSLVSQSTIELNIDMKSFKPQVYILKITNHDGEVVATEKIIKR